MKKHASSWTLWSAGALLQQKLIPFPLLARVSDLSENEFELAQRRQIDASLSRSKSPETVHKCSFFSPPSPSLL